MSRTLPGVTVLIICLVLATIPTTAYAKPSTPGQHVNYPSLKPSPNGQVFEEGACLTSPG